MNDQTQGERYKYSPGEQENMDKFGDMLREAFKKLDEAKDFARDNGFGWSFHLWLDKDINDEYKVPTNYNTEITINVQVDDEWLMSTQDC